MAEIIRVSMPLMTWVLTMSAALTIGILLGAWRRR